MANNNTGDGKFYVAKVGRALIGTGEKAKEVPYAFHLQARLVRDPFFKDEDGAFAVTSAAIDHDIWDIYERAADLEKSLGNPETNFFTITASGSIAKSVKEFKKGESVVFSGPLDVRKEKDKDGNERPVVRLSVKSIAPMDGSEGTNWGCATKVWNEHQTPIVSGLTGEIKKTYGVREHRKYGNSAMFMVRIDQPLDIAFADALGIPAGEGNIHTCFVSVGDSNGNDAANAAYERFAEGDRVIISGKPKIEEQEDGRSLYSLQIKGGGTKLSKAFTKKEAPKAEAEASPAYVPKPEPAKEALSDAPKKSARKKAEPKKEAPKPEPVIEDDEPFALPFDDDDFDDDEE